MRTFTYRITDPLGIHARPAALLAKEAAAFADTAITVEKVALAKAAEAGQLLRLMSLGIRQGDEIRVTATGRQEDAAIAALEAFFHAHL